MPVHRAPLSLEKMLKHLLIMLKYSMKK